MFISKLASYLILIILLYKQAKCMLLIIISMIRYSFRSVSVLVSQLATSMPYAYAYWFSARKL